MDGTIPRDMPAILAPDQPFGTGLATSRELPREDVFKPPQAGPALRPKAGRSPRSIPPG